ncbi:MAG: SLBB domain-containing protein [Fimbriimonadaceae bacterium]
MKLFAKIVCTLCLISFASAQNPPVKEQDPKKGGEPAKQDPKADPKTESRGESKPVKKDPLTVLREQARGGQLSPGAALIVVEPIPVKKVRVGEALRFKVYARMKTGSNPVSFFLTKPMGAEVDSTTGVVSWVPTKPGHFELELMISDSTAPEVFKLLPFEVEVEKPIELFGYNYFIAPRAAIQARLMAFANGLSRPGLPVWTGNQSQGLIPDGTSNQPPLSDFMKSVQSNSGFQPVTVSPPQSGALNGAIGNGTNGTTATQSGGTTLPDVRPDLQQGAGQAQIAPPSDPTNRVRNEQMSRSLIDAQNYFVGPFDMAGGANVFVPAPERYQLGAGDVLLIRFWSPTIESREVSVAVDARGSIGIPSSGRKITVRGKSLDSAEAMIRKEMAKDLIGVEVSVTLRELRTMSLTVIGEAFLPGSYQVPAVATLFNALYMCGGPTENGTLRRIMLRRNDGTQKIFDMYRFLIDGDSSQDVPLQPGDTIFIPTAEGRISVMGEVGRPAIYEVLPKEHLKQIIKFAGGARPSGVTQRVGLSTVEPGQGLKLKDVDLNGSGPTSDPVVFAGDSVEVYSVRPVMTNLVTLEGAVDQPGKYALSDGMKLRDLIARARGPIQEANLVRADLFRQNADGTTKLIPIHLAKAINGDAEQNIPLVLFDRIVVYRVDETKWMGERLVTVSGAVRHPGEFARSDDMRILDLILQAGGLNGDAFQPEGFLQRVNPDGSNGELVKIDFRKAAIGDQAHNIVLLDRDRLIVQTAAEAVYTPTQVVRILGAVQRPGEFPSASNLKVSDLIKQAGGVMPNAGGNLEIARARVKEGTPAERYALTEVLSGKVDPPLAPGDLVTLPAENNFQMTPRTVVILGAVARPGPYAINSATDKIADVIDRAGGLTATAFARGAQFSRSPENLGSLFQRSLSPRLQEVLEIISDDEYQRASAKAEMEKARFAKSLNQPVTSIGITGAPTSQSAGPTIVPQFEKDTVTRARRLRAAEVEPAGNVNVRLDDALKNRRGPHNLVLMQGDIIVIPETPSTVQISGAIVVPSSILFENGKNLLWYINKCGGLLPDASTNLIYVIRANGEVVKGKGSTKIELGDLIYVPTKVMAERLSDRQAEIDAFSRNVTSAGILISIIKSLGGF